MSIQEYFNDKVVLVTGGTGLVGRILVEKVLRDLPQIRRLYVLVRPRTDRSGRAVSADERLHQEIFASSAFDRLRLRLGDAFEPLVREKVEAVAGDLSEENLGLDDATRQRLQSEVQVIINCAAAVAFDGDLEVALELNTMGPVRVLEFARGCPDAILAHVSTCYVNGTRQGLVSEEPLDPAQAMAGVDGTSRKPYDVEDEVAALSRLKEPAERRSRKPWRRAMFAWAARRQKDGHGNLPEPERLRQDWVRQRLIAEGMRWARSRGWNDIYTFTKAMGEQMIMRHRGDVPTVIFRPSIIESAFEVPEPGWLDGLRMLDPLIIAFGRKQLPDFPGDPEVIVDMVPVDMVVNALLACIPTAHQQGGQPVYQIATGTDNPLSLKTFSDLVQEHFRREPLSGRGGPSKELARITFPSTKSFLRRLRFRYLLPLRGLEALGLLCSILPWGRRLRRTARSRHASVERLAYWARIYSPYSNAHCLYQSQRMGEVLASLSQEERQLFSFDVTRIDWQRYIQQIHIPGIQRFLLGIGPRPVPELEEPGAEKRMDWVRAEAHTTHAKGHRTSLNIDVPNEQEVKRRLGARWLWRPARGLTRLLVSLAYRFYLGFHWEGMENLPPKGPMIVATNHSSHLDTGALLVLLGKRYPDLHPVAAKDYFFKNKRWSWISRVFIDAIPFDRHAHFTDGLGLAVALLRQNHVLIFYPEGGRSITGDVQPFKAGVGLLALESGAPIIPVYISGSFEALAKGRSIPKRHPIHVRFGAPILVETYLNGDSPNGSQETARRITEDVQKAVKDLS